MFNSKIDLSAKKNSKMKTSTPNIHALQIDLKFTHAQNK